MESINDLIVRRFTKALEEDKDKTVYDLFEWRTVDVLIKDYSKEKVICKMHVTLLPPTILERPVYQMR